MSKSEKNNGDIISSLTGTSLRVFTYALKQKESVGVREVQRRLGFKSPSLAQYHLTRLEELEILEKTQDNRYTITSDFSDLRSLKLGILTEVYVFRGWLIPALGFFAGFLGVSGIILPFLHFYGSAITALFFGTIVLLSSCLYLALKTKEVINDLNSEL